MWGVVAVAVVSGAYSAYAKSNAKRMASESPEDRAARMAATEARHAKSAEFIALRANANRRAKAAWKAADKGLK